MDPDEPESPFQLRDRVRNKTLMPHQRDQPRNEQRAREEPLRPVFRIGGSVIRATPPDTITSEPSSSAQQGLPIATAKLSRTQEESMHFQNSTDQRALGPGC